MHRDTGTKSERMRLRGMMPSSQPLAKRHVLSITQNHFGYTGQQQDPSSGLMMLGYYRAYSPMIAAFLKEDTLTAFSRANTRNGFEYASDNPLIFTDPTGHFSWKQFGSGFGEFMAGFMIDGMTLA